MPDPHQALRVTVNVPREGLSYRFRIGKRQFLAGVRGPQETFFCNRRLEVGENRKIMLRASDFVSQSKEVMKDWNEITTFRIDVYDGVARHSLHFTSPENQKLFSKLEWVEP